MSTNPLFKDYVPHISKAEFDDEAKKFLERYCPEALVTPMAVPIEEIASKKMGLTILEERLSEDFSILGQMCFTKGIAEIYDKDEDEYREIYVKAGTMIIDPDTLLRRNLGSKRITVSHECVHWTKHRNYHILSSAQSGQAAKACRCPAEEKDYTYNRKWTDEDWMEWQANGISPRILMPRETFGLVYERLLEESKEQPFIKAKLYSQQTWIIEQLAGFYQVSKQAARIRLCELGYLPA